MDFITLKEITHNFQKELERACAGRQASLSWIKNTLPSFSLVRNGEVFQVIAIGGTFFRNALLHKEDDQLSIISLSEGTLPLFATKDIFFEFLLSQLATDITQLTINFGFPLQPQFDTDHLDGILIHPTKEHAFEGLVGETVGRTFSTYVQNKTGKKITTSLANDTICLLLSGLMQYQSDEIAAGIVGTGINGAFFSDEKTLINLETGSFDKFPQTKSGRIIDKTSLQKGKQLFEKEISGGFLYQHFNLLLGKKHIPHQQIHATKELSDIAQTDTDSISRNLAIELLKQSAELTATTLAAITNYKKRNTIFIMQGSLFWKGYQYKETVSHTVEKLTPYTVLYINIEHADILGAAKLIA